MYQHKLTETGLDTLLSQHHRQPQRFIQPHPNLSSIPSLPILLHLTIAASYKCLYLPSPPIYSRAWRDRFPPLPLAAIITMSLIT